MLMKPPQAKGHTSVARIMDDWYVACFSKELRSKPLKVRVMGLPLVLFRGEAGLGALMDRCPHRNVPLSKGRVVGCNLECAYHGWQFDPEGVCREVPGLCGAQEGKARQAMAFPVREQDGLVWVYPSAGARPEREPYRMPLVGKPGYATAYERVEAKGSLHSVAENALDVPHTAFLHRGLFRGTGERNRIQVEVRRWHDRVEAEYIGEPAPKGLAGRLLAPGGGTVQHFDRFHLPCIAEVEYKLGERSHINVSTALTPVEDFHTRLHAVISFKLPIPTWLVKLVLKPVGKAIFNQDARMLVLQTQTIHDFGGEQYANTEIDVLGPHILRLLRNAERGDRAALEAPVTKSLELLA